MRGLFLMPLLILFLSCLGQSEKRKTDETENLNEYWFQGKAEISTFELSQNRYNAQHPGEAVLIFVTEDFLVQKQVKNDSYQNPKSTKILKTNLIRRFTTGMYDYSIMTSVFSAIDQESYPGSFKVSMSSLDWCGQSFMQINRRKENYQVELRSYFESEGDQSFNLKRNLLEDEIWNMIRFNPDKLPYGVVQIIPSTSFLRLSHQQTKAVQAMASMKSYDGSEFDGDLMEYNIDFSSQRRSLQIIFERNAPHQIQGWIESYPSAFDGKVRKSIAKRKHIMMSPYWQKNSPQDSSNRKLLQLNTY